MCSLPNSPIATIHACARALSTGAATATSWTMLNWSPSFTFPLTVDSDGVAYGAGGDDRGAYIIRIPGVAASAGGGGAPSIGPAPSPSAAATATPSPAASSSNAAPSPPPGGEGGGRLSGVQIGLVAGALVGVVGAAGGGWWWRQQRRAAGASATAGGPAGALGNALRDALGLSAAPSAERHLAGAYEALDGATGGEGGGSML